MKVFYCRECWIYVKTEYEENDDGSTNIDKKSVYCKECEPPTPHYHTLRTHCKRGHLLDAVHFIKGVPSRYCKICARMSEQKHRNRNPGYHSKFKKVKDAT